MNIAVITGASSGIGREFVTALDKEYEFDEIWVIARRLERLTELSTLCRSKLRCISLDLSDDSGWMEYRRTEENGVLTFVRNDQRFPCGATKMDCYLPWEDHHVPGTAPELPPFVRSVVVRFPTMTARAADTVIQH